MQCARATEDEEIGPEQIKESGERMFYIEHKTFTSVLKDIEKDLMENSAIRQKAITKSTRLTKTACDLSESILSKYGMKRDFKLDSNCAIATKDLSTAPSQIEAEEIVVYARRHLRQYIRLLILEFTNDWNCDNINSILTSDSDVETKTCPEPMRKKLNEIVQNYIKYLSDSEQMSTEMFVNVKKEVLKMFKSERQNATTRIRKTSEKIITYCTDHMNGKMNDDEDGEKAMISSALEPAKRFVKEWWLPLETKICNDLESIRSDVCAFEWSMQTIMYAKHSDFLREVFPEFKTMAAADKNKLLHLKTLNAEELQSDQALRKEIDEIVNKWSEPLQNAHDVVKFQQKLCIEWTAEINVNLSLKLIENVRLAVHEIFDKKTSKETRDNSVLYLIHSLTSRHRDREVAKIVIEYAELLHSIVSLLNSSPVFDLTKSYIFLFYAA